MSTINNIAHYYKGIYTDENYESFTDSERAIELEDHLIGVCNHLAEAQKLTYSKNIDVEYLLNVVGSYLMGVQEGQLDDSTEPPSKLFEESLYPALHNIDNEVIKEIDDDSTEDSTAPIGDDT